MALYKYFFTAMFPCPICDIPLDVMKTTSPLDLVIPSTDGIQLLTFGDLKENARQFEEKFSGDTSKGKHCKSTVNRCLIKVILNLTIR